MQKTIEEKIYCRWSPTLGALEATHQEVWGTEDYNPDLHREGPCVFFGLYGLPDFYALWKHRGKKWVLWAGSDIRNFINGYFLDSRGTVRLDYRPLADWISDNCESWVENRAEFDVLKETGIKSKICPSFLGDVNKFKVSYKWTRRPKIYASVSGNDFGLYCWREIEQIAMRNNQAEFHLYGNSLPWTSFAKNIFVHGRVSQEQMNKEIKDMQATIRLLPLEGCSEVVVKAALMGQYVISKIKYPYTSEEIKIGRKPNLKCREWFLRNLNQYPWNKYAEK